MISSEVQRTLVKSPPELWTELSDQDALARHLGELGEIKITRTQPEELIEWEAEGTTGTVAIKPSGWGTKVTLTVTRELPPAEDTEGVEASKPEAGEDIDSASVAGIAEDQTETEPEPEPERQEPRPAPATEAARRAAGRPTSGAAAGPAIESDLRSTEGAERSENGGLAEWHAGLEPSAGPERAPEQSGAPEPEPLAAATGPETLPAAPEPERAAAPEPEARRGFFARLFGGKRRRAAVPRAPESLRATPAAPDADPTPPDSEPLAGIKPEPQAFPVTVGAEREPLADTAPQPAEETSDLDEGPVPEHVAALDDDDATEPVAASEDDDATEPAEGATEASEAIDAEVAAALTDSRDTAAEATGADLAGELLAAEEIAADEVKTVLTGVLDRLGAAHHRPFSRA